MNASTCTECGSTDTDRQSTLHNGDTITLVYICLDCPTQFSVHYEAAHAETDFTEAEA